MERTLIIAKPDAVQRGLVGEIIRRLERKGLKLIGLKMLSLDEEQRKDVTGVSPTASVRAIARYQDSAAVRTPGSIPLEHLLHPVDRVLA